MSLERSAHPKLRAHDDEPLLKVRGLKKYFQQSDSFLDKLVGHSSIVQAVDGVNLTIEEGETLGLVGESGCGKSTLGRTILNLDTPTDGTVKFRCQDITEFSASEMQAYRRQAQMIFQNPLSSLNPRQTIGEILTAPMEVHEIRDSKADRLEYAERLLERIGLKPGYVDRHPHQFSGGQQQRIAIARALTVEPDLLIADEPVSSLDVSVQAQILSLLEDIQEEFGLAILFIDHDLSVIRHIADRVSVMYLGEIVETAPVEELFAAPQHPYTKSLLSAVPRINPAARTERIILEGTVPSPLDPPDGCRFHTRCPVVIPPAEWQADQATFKAAFTFRTRVLSGELDPDAIRTRLDAKVESLDDETVAAHIIEEALPCDLTDLPEDASAQIEDVATALATGENDRAADIARKSFPSPCEQQVPQSSETNAGHSVTCHRIDPDAVGEPVDFG